MREIRKHTRDVVAIVTLAVVALAVAYYIVQHQRVRIPLLEAKPFVVRFQLETAQAVTPGQGQTVRVSGIRVGDVSDVELVDGRAIVTAELDEKYDGLVRTNSTALLRPKTGLKDMFIELDPGTTSAAALEAGGVVPVRSTLPDVNPDEILAGLDADTRDYLVLLLNGASTGLRGRSDDLSRVLERFEPTYRDLARVSAATAARQRELRRLVNSLNRLNRALAAKDDELAGLVVDASSVFRAVASERDNVAASVRELAPALRVTGDAFGDVDELARVLAPAAENLRPAVRSLTTANESVTPFAQEATPLLRDDIRPFVREARPFVSALRPAAADLVDAEPFLTRSVVVLNHLFNMLGYNPDGREGAGVEGRDEGYLFWFAWLAHLSSNLFSSADAHGPFRPLTLGGTCGTLRALVGFNPLAEFGLGLSGVLTDPRVCGGELGQLPEPSVPGFGAVSTADRTDDTTPTPEERTPADEEPAATAQDEGGG